MDMWFILNLVNITKKTDKQMLNIYNPLIWMCIYDYKSSQMENIQ